MSIKKLMTGTYHKQYSFDTMKELIKKIASNGFPKDNATNELKKLVLMLIT